MKVLCLVVYCFKVCMAQGLRNLCASRAGVCCVCVCGGGGAHDCSKGSCHHLLRYTMS
jgi:hypothetical protein